MRLKFEVGKESSKKTVKHILKVELGLSERLVKRLKYSSCILKNSQPVFVNELVEAGDIIEAVIDFTEVCDDIVPENIPIDIIYEDECLIVLNKQPYIVVHPTSTHPSGTIANALMHHFISHGTHRKIRPVSRLDRDTSGIIIFAKNEYVQESLIKQMGDKSFSKEYIGVVHGIVSEKAGTINLPIERKPDSIMLRCVSPTGAPSITHFEVGEYLGNSSFLRFWLETGRTHQIRVHCQSIGHPLIGDTLYPLLDNQPQISSFRVKNSVDSLSNENNNPGEILIGRQALHSQKVEFTHPYTRKPMELRAPIPEDINYLIQKLRLG